MTNVGFTFNKRGLVRKVQWFSQDPREVCENRCGSRSIWVRRGAERYRNGPRWPQAPRTSTPT